MEAKKMPIKDILQLSRCIDRIKAEENLIQLNISDYPRMDKKSRKDFYKAIHKKANPDFKEKTVSGSEMARKLKEWQMKK